MVKINEEKIKKLEKQIEISNDLTIDGAHQKICPKCGSTEIGVEAENLRANDFCKTCGYNSIKSGMVEMMHFPTKPKGDK